MFPCELCETFPNSFFTDYLRMIAFFVNVSKKMRKPKLKGNQASHIECIKYSKNSSRNSDKTIIKDTLRRCHWNFYDMIFTTDVLINCLLLLRFYYVHITKKLTLPLH